AVVQMHQESQESDTVPPKRKRRWRRFFTILSCVLLLVFVPYLWSRLASSWRQVTIHQIPASAAAAAAQLQDRVESQDQKLKLLSYNIAHGRGLAVSNWEGGNAEQREQRLDELAELLKKLDADIVVLNEVDFQTSWSYGVNQAQYLAEKAGYEYRVEQRNIDFRLLFWTCRFGNAVLSKYPIRDAKVVNLPSFAEWENLLAGKKKAVFCQIESPSQTIGIIGAHLSHRSETLRAQSAEHIVKLLEDSQQPVFLAGDLNSTPSGFPESKQGSNNKNAIEVFDASGKLQRTPMEAPQRDEQLTFHADSPQNIIDWVLIPNGWSYTDYHVELSKLSDHRPVLVEVSPK
ncbi:MAG: endonuclease/exonuclease/phosphatase family protein, partial [Planctomycetota bacterium]